MAVVPINVLLFGIRLVIFELTHDSVAVQQMGPELLIASFVVSNDTGPAHIASHLRRSGLALFGSHTSAEKVSIGNSTFKIISAKKLEELKVDIVMDKIKTYLN